MVRSSCLMAAAAVLTSALLFSQPTELPGRAVSLDEAESAMGALCWNIIEGSQTVCSEECGFDVINAADTEDESAEFRSTMCTNISTCTAPKDTGWICSFES